MKTLLQKISTSLALLVIAMFAMPQSNADAQYCGFETKQYWNQYAMINSVTVTDVTEGETVLERTGTGWEQWATVDMTEGPYELNIGNDFEIEVEWGNVYGAYLRAYIDRNDDQRWEWPQLGPNEEYLGRIYRYNGFVYPAVPQQFDVFEMSIDDDVAEGPSVLRIIANYSWNTQNPCEIYLWDTYAWAYGEVEDYAINFTAPIPETYPTAGNILFNEEAYDGTTRMFNGQMTEFKLPAVEFKGPQANGTKYMYEISGPLPSNEVVYTALDPVTGDEEIEITTSDAYFEIKSAIGSASVSTSEGTFLPTKGGEYRVKATLIKTSGKRAEGINVFTVANDYDMSISSIVSPRTSRFPRFFKYLDRTNIDVISIVQNTGLNPVSKFEVTANIYDADTDEIIETLPKFVYDADSDPNLFPLASGEKKEIEFAAFFSDAVGEFYVEFEVFYDFDEEEFNNTLPRPETAKHYFEVQYNDQLTAGDFLFPTVEDTLKVNKPFAPKVLFENNGISDASNINFTLVINDDEGNEVYSEVSFLENLPQGRYNERIVEFPTGIIQEEGNYKGCAWVNYLADNVKSDDTVCVSFIVEKGIQDTITVGETNSLTELTNDELVSNENPSSDDNTVVVENSELFTFNSITPNPAMSSTRLDFVNDNNEALTIEVVDMNGQIVKSGVTNKSNYELTVSELSSGNYTLVVRSGNTVQTRQLNVVK